MKKILSIFFVSLFALTANAQTASIGQATCPISTSGIKTLLELQSSPDPTPEMLAQELTLRKQLLFQTIACANQNAESLQVKLRSVDAAGEGGHIQSLLDSKINDAINFYALESTKVDGSGIRATKALATEIVAWRSANYAPLEGQVNNFLLWNKNQGLFRTAQERFDRTARLVNFIRTITPENNLETALATVRASLTDAQEQNSAASNALNQLLPPDQSLALIQASLQSLADTYQKFKDLNTLIQELLPAK